jgi:hypothetical protein
MACDVLEEGIHGGTIPGAARRPAPTPDVCPSGLQRHLPLNQRARPGPTQALSVEPPSLSSKALVAVSRRVQRGSLAPRPACASSGNRASYAIQTTASRQAARTQALTSVTLSRKSPRTAASMSCTSLCAENPLTHSRNGPAAPTTARRGAWHSAPAGGPADRRSGAAASSPTSQDLGNQPIHRPVDMLRRLGSARTHVPAR